MLTLIAYKPSGKDTCMGNVVARFSDDFGLFHYDDGDADTLVKDAAGFLTRNSFLDYAEPEFMVTILHNSDPIDALAVELYVKAEALATKKIAEKNADLLEKKRIKDAQKERQKQDEELIILHALQAKYKGKL